MKSYEFSAAILYFSVLRNLASVLLPSPPALKIDHACGQKQGQPKNTERPRQDKQVVRQSFLPSEEGFHLLSTSCWLYKYSVVVGQVLFSHQERGVRLSVFWLTFISSSSTIFPWIPRAVLDPAGLDGMPNIRVLAKEEDWFKLSIFGLGTA